MNLPLWLVFGRIDVSPKRMTAGHLQAHKPTALVIPSRVRPLSKMGGRREWKCSTDQQRFEHHVFGELVKSMPEICRKM